MLKSRFFIAINLPEDTKQELSRFESLWPEIPAKWVDSENIHITLSFLGTIEKEDVQKVENALTETTHKIAPLNITVTEVSCISDSSKTPEMIWAIIEKSDDLIHLQENVEKGIRGACKLEVATQEKSFVPHATLARIKKWKMKQLDTRDLPRMDEEIFGEFRVSSIELMESKLTKNGPKYRIVKSFPLKGTVNS